MPCLAALSQAVKLIPPTVIARTREVQFTSYIYIYIVVVPNNAYPNRGTDDTPMTVSYIMHVEIGGTGYFSYLFPKMYGTNYVIINIYFHYIYSLKYELCNCI